MLAPFVATSALPEQVRYCFRFQINGTSDPDFIMPAGAVKDITRSSAGVFVVKLNDGQRPAGLVGLVGSVLEATQAHDLMVKGSVAGYDATTGFLTITVVGADGTTAAEDPADNDWVYVEATFQRRSVYATAGSI